MTYKNILIGMTIAAAVIFILLALTVFNGADRGNFTESSVQTSRDYISARTPVRQEIYYNGCQHLVASVETGSATFSDRSFEQLTADGWEVFWGEHGQAVAFREADGLCPADQQTLRLGAYQGKVAIFAGSPNRHGQPAEVTDIYLDDLPPEIRDQIAAADLEFYTREELNAALENLE